MLVVVVIVVVAVVDAMGEPRAAVGVMRAVVVAALLGAWDPWPQRPPPPARGFFLPRTAEIYANGKLP
jgi:hypothetical protein